MDGNGHHSTDCVLCVSASHHVPQTALDATMSQRHEMPTRWYKDRINVNEWLMGEGQENAAIIEHVFCTRHCGRRWA